MGWSEIILVAVVALIVVGPKDLPVLFQSLGRMTAKVRSMAREFSQAMNEAADSTGMADVAKDFRDATSSKALGMDKLREATDSFEKWDPTKPVKDTKAKSKDKTGDKAKDAEAKEAKDTPERGPHTAAFTEERKADADRIREYSAKKAQERLDREKAEAAAKTKPEAEAEAPKTGDTA